MAVSEEYVYYAQGNVFPGMGTGSWNLSDIGGNILLVEECIQDIRDA